MTPDEMERAIYETFIENYDATPALHLAFRLNAKRATRRIVAEQSKPRRRSRVYMHPREVEERDNTIIDMYNSGLSLTEIGNEIDMSPTGVWKVLKRRGVPRRRQGQQPYQIRNAS